MPLQPKETAAAPYFRDLAEDWLTERAQDLRSHRDDRNRWTKHLAPRLEPLQIDKVDNVVMSEIKNACAKTLDPASV
ncbi:MAG TPA: hypothetical protein VFH73_21090, partial [Polyangia bacterium]|nr:hypothetical protein [Polyangia bacterium]